MARRRVDLAHPRPWAVADTVRQEKTSFSGAAAFLAGEGALPFAADREGLADVFERLWLRPSAARRLAGYLDLRPTGVIGYRVRVDPGAPQQLDARPDTLTTLSAMQGDVIDTDRQLCVVSCAPQDGAWPLEASLGYQHHFKLSGGQWSIDQPLVALRARTLGEDLLLAALVSRAEDIAQVRRAVNALERKADGLLLEEIALSEDAARRHEELRRVLLRLGDSERLRVGATTTRERAGSASEPPPTDAWASHNEASSYRMRPHTVELMLRRIEQVDDASFASAIVYLPDSSGLVLAVTLRQNSGRDDHLGVFCPRRPHARRP